MRDNLEKAKLYLTSNPEYWKLSPEYTGDQKVGFYPLSFKDRLVQNHYQHFDEHGLPMFHSSAGELVHFCTGMCSFAFAHWEMYLLTNDDHHAQKVTQVAEKLKELAVSFPSGVSMVYDYDNEQKENPVACAMNQGESISVLCMAYSYSGNKEFLDFARQLAKAFSSEYGEAGVVGRLDENQMDWYLEGGKKILNGHNYALFGLRELSRLVDEEWIEERYQNGIESLIESIDLFDSGRWSWYWREQPLYIASAMYHNLHVCQLEVLAGWEESGVLMKYRDKFVKYVKSPLKRIRAGKDLFVHKVKKRA